MTTTTTTRPALRVRGLRKSFGDKVVLDGVDLEVAEGTVFALLGPNGAGKTTTVQILTTLLAPDDGAIELAGHDPVLEPGAVREVIGVTGQFSAVDNLLTGEENLLLMADLHHLERREARSLASGLLDRFDLTDAADQVVATYSGGMRRRLDLAMTLVGDPQIIFLDEPTTGLDPRSRRTMWSIVEDLTASGVTVFLTTQHLDEADRLADRVAVLDRGRVVVEGTPAELKRRVPGGHALLYFGDAVELDLATALVDGARDDDALSLQVATDGTPRALIDLFDRLERHGAQVARVTVHTPDLDDVFLASTGAANDRDDEEQST